MLNLTTLTKGDIEFLWFMVVLAVISGNLAYDAFGIISGKFFSLLREAFEAYSKNGVKNRK